VIRTNGEEDESINEIVADTIERFCEEFVENPYLCYTEHGFHALLFHELFEGLSKHGVDLYRPFKTEEMGKEEMVCLLQKEYRGLRKFSRREQEESRETCAHWDIALFDPSLERRTGSSILKLPVYDSFKLHSVIELGFNNEPGHLDLDIERLDRERRGIRHMHILNLCRIGSRKVSVRNWTPKREINNRPKESQFARALARGISTHYARVQISDDGTHVTDITHRYAGDA
jgi:hypothetical protein